MWGFFYAFRKFFLTFFGRCDIICGSEENFMSDNIIEFPVHLTAGSQRTRNELADMGHSLERVYESLEEAMTAMSEMESAIKELENRYNEKLLELAEQVGIENLTIDDVKYATNIGVGTGSREFTFELEDGKMFKFVLEEDPSE